MEVYALIGASGTGKSHRANVVAHNTGADVIIDDGLLIKDNQILSGVSSKIRPTRIGAIKTALFMDDEQAGQAKEVLSRLKPEKVLILGTSRGMAEKIARRLDLQPISKFLNIEDVATVKEIRKARAMRSQHSKHVIPAPTMEVRKSLPETLVDPLQVFLRKKTKGKEKHDAKNWLEQSVVRPTFTYYGRLTISQHALSSIAKITAEQVEGVSGVKSIHLKRVTEGVILEISLVLLFGTRMDTTGARVQSEIKEQMEHMTGLFVKEIHILIAGVHIAEPGDDTKE